MGPALFLQQTYDRNERKMNMKKRVLALLMTLAMIFSLAACGGSGGSGGSGGGESAAGTYNLTKMSSGGEEISMEEMSEIAGMDVSMTLELTEDNKFTMDMGVLGDGEKVSGTWKMDGDSLILSAEGDELSVTYDGKTIVLDMEGEGLTFEKQ